jgi:hypothetical protein
VLRYLGPLAALALVFVVYRDVARRCRINPGHRPWFIVGAVCALVLAGLLIPWLLAKLNPPWSESPSGLLVYLGKAAVVGFLALTGTGALIGAVRPGRSDSAA